MAMSLEEQANARDILLRVCWAKGCDCEPKITFGDAPGGLSDVNVYHDLDCTLLRASRAPLN